MPSTIASAYVQIIPSMEGVQEQLSKAMDGAAESAGSSAGEKAGSSFGSKLATAAKVGAAAIATATAAVSKFAADSVGVGMGFDASMSQVAATMGTTVDQIQNLRDFAMEMGSTTAFSAGQAADALNYMALAGYDAETSMEMLPNVLNLAAAGGIELARASDMVTDASSALGLSLDETAELVDKMAQASSKSNTSVAQLGDAILTVGGTAKNLAGGTTELSTALGILADNGVKGAEGGTALRNIILSLSAPTDTAAKTMERFGINAFDANGNLRPLNETFADLNGVLSTMTSQEQTEVLNTLFNKVDLKSVNALLANTGDNFKAITEGLENSGVAWEKYANAAWAADGAQEGLFADLQYNLNDIQNNAAEMAEYLQFEYDIDAEDAQKIIESINTSITDQATRWDELSGYIDDATGAAEQMADTQLDNLAGDITLFQSALEGAKIAVSDQLTPALREFVQFGSDGLSKLTQAFQEGGLTGAMDALGGILSDGLAMIIEKLPEAIDAGAQLLGALVQGIITNMPTMANAAIQIVTQLGTYLIESLPNMMTSLTTMVMDIATMITDPANLSALLNIGLDLILALADGIMQSIPELISRLPELITNIVDFLLDSIPDIIQAGIDLLSALVDDLPTIIDAVVTALPELIDGTISGILEHIPEIIQAGIDLLTELISDIPAIVSAIVDALPKLIDGVIDGLLDNLPAIIDAGIQLFVSIIEDLPAIIAGIVEHIPEIIEGILNAFSDIAEKLWTVGGDIVKGIWEGISNAAGWLWDKITGWVGGVVDGIKGFLGIHSPSTVFAGIGENMGEGIGVGFQDAMTDVRRDMESAIPTSFDVNSSGIGSGVYGDAYTGAGGSGMSNAITINVQASPGMDERGLAEEIERRLMTALDRRQAAWA